jgi:hypothetical protein
MSRADFERAKQAARRVVIEEARAKVAEVEAQLAAARLERQRAARTRIVRKMVEDALVDDR